MLSEIGTRISEKAKSWWSATFWTFWATVRSAANLRIERYPEIRRNDRLVDLTNDELVRELVTATKSYEKLSPTDADKVPIDDAINLAKASLEESKKQTEYQDNKASRLLTVTSFVSALSGVLLATFADRYPLDQIKPSENDQHWLLIAGYSAFLLFVLFTLCGALVTFHATRTRFKYTSDAAITDESKPANSMLFYKGIAGTGPTGWAESYVSSQTQPGLPGQPDMITGASIRNDLKVIYFRHYVIEAYLVAAKTADKLRYLAPAQALLAWALRLLIIFVTLFAFAVSFVPSAKPAPGATDEVKIQPVTQPVPVRIVGPPPAPAPAAAPASGASPPREPAEGQGR
jgi:hypothetical protein